MNGSSPAFSQMFLESVITVLSSKQLLLALESLSFVILNVISYLLIKKYTSNNQQINQNKYSFYLLSIIIISMIVDNFSWICKLTHGFGYLNIHYDIIKYIIMIAWVFSIIMYQFLGLFIENISKNKFEVQWHQRLFFITSSAVIVTFLSTFIYTVQGYQTYISIHTMFRFVPFYRIWMVLISTIIVLRSISLNKIPSIIKEQVKTFLKSLIVPLLIIDSLESIPFFFKQGAYADISGLIANISVSFMICLIIYVTFKLLKFRLFNFSEKIDDGTTFNLDSSFNEAVIALTDLKDPHQLLAITNDFLRKSCGISSDDTLLATRFSHDIYTSARKREEIFLIYNQIEKFFYQNPAIIASIKKQHCIVSDEAIFDAYGNTSTPEKVAIADFMTVTNCQVFVPIFKEEKLIGYIAIQQSKKRRFFTRNEQMKMVLFARNLAFNLVIMESTNQSAFMAESKALKEELQFKKQEGFQYVESVKSMLQKKSDEQVGVVFYRKNQFIYGNVEAQNLLGAHLNDQKKHPISTALTTMARQVASFRIAQSAIVKNNQQTKIKITVLPNNDVPDGVIATVHYPDTSDVIKSMLDNVSMPTRIDYLLYLETTKIGKMVSKLIPSNTEMMVNFKIKLLEMVLHAKANLIYAHPDDVQDIVEIIHLTSLRSTLYTLELQKNEENGDLQVKLFGINPFFSKEKLANKEHGILQTLHNDGTLFIKNVDFMDLQTQNKLAHFIRYGLYTITHSEKQAYSNVRVICSVSKSPHILIDENKLSIDLHKQLHDSTIQIPSLMTMDNDELCKLMNSIIDQESDGSTIAHLLKLSKKEQEFFSVNRPVSLREFKLKIKNLLHNRLNEYHIFEKVLDTGAEENLEKPELIKAATLGKHALKDKQLMTLLWNEFHCQNRIAKLLGVNRSSVQRRCKEYGLE